MVTTAQDDPGQAKSASFFLFSAYEKPAEVLYLGHRKIRNWSVN